MYIFDKNNILYHVSFGNHNKVGLTFYEKFIVERDTKSKTLAKLILESIEEPKINNALEKVLLSY